MDFGQLFNTLLNSLPNQVWFFVPLFILLPILRTPWFKGKAGEAVVNLAEKLFLDKARYHLLKNVTLPTEDGTTQIDEITGLLSELRIKSLRKEVRDKSLKTAILKTTSANGVVV